MNRYGSGAYAVDQQFSLYDAASDDQKFKLVTVNNKQRIAMNGNTSLGLNVYRSGDNPCTLYTLLNNDNDSQVSIEACSEGVQQGTIHICNVCRSHDVSIKTIGNVRGRI